MDLQTISTVSKSFKISTRTLRYYEELGLLKSIKMDGYAYRVYDSDSLNRLKQIVVLRKLRIPLKSIREILRCDETAVALDVFRSKVNELSGEIEALSAVRAILSEFVTRLKDSLEIRIDPGLLTDESTIKVIDSLTRSKPSLKEESVMTDLNRADESLSKLTDVRIVYLPPATVAGSHFYCDEPEAHAGEVIDRFVRESDLCEIKPDIRHYGFNHPNSSPDTPEGSPDHGYEMWVTIPDDMAVPEPLVKKHFAGGLYAAHMIKMGDFHEWEWLYQWVQNNEEYEPNFGDPECMHGLLEECLNYIGRMKSPDGDSHDVQLDLLFPVKPRQKKA